MMDPLGLSLENARKIGHGVQVARTRAFVEGMAGIDCAAVSNSVTPASSAARRSFSPCSAGGGVP